MKRGTFGLVLLALSLLLLNSCTEQLQPSIKKPIACTLDAKQCPDGSGVGRDPNNNCEFFPCPDPKNACPADVKQCPDGSYVNRDPKNNCAFMPCKEEKIDIQEQREVKSYLIDKYNPGTCFGMPGMLDPDTREKIMKERAELVSYIKKRFGHTEESWILERLLQFEQIHLTKIPVGYDFTFENGDCCWITHNEGKIILDQKSITDTITSSTSRSEPC